MTGRQMTRDEMAAALDAAIMDALEREIFLLQHALETVGKVRKDLAATRVAMAA
jgi:hypothetical protein